MKKFLLFLILLIAILAVAVAVVPSVIDWNKYKPQIANQIDQVIGREVLIDGNVSFKLFPYPFLSLGQTRIRNISGSEQESMANIKNIEIRVEPYSLLKGEIRMRRISLIEPEILFEVLPNGEVNWNFSFLQKQETANFDDSFGKTTVKDSVILDSVTIQNGTINYSNKKSNIEENLKGITAEVIAGSLKGPYRVDGNFDVRGSKAGFAFSIGEIGTSSPTEINFTLSELSAEAVLNMSGIISDVSTGNLFDGNISFNVKKLPVLLSILDTNAFFPESLATEVALNSSFSYKTGLLNIEDLVLKYGDNAAAGGASISLEEGKIPEITSSLYFTQFVLEPFLKAIKEMETANRPILNKLKISDKLNLKLELGASSVTYKDSSIKNIESKLEFKDSHLNVESAQLNMIGNSVLSFSGTVTPVEDTLNYDLDVDFQAENTRQLLRWLGHEEKIASESVFRNSSFKGNLKGNLLEIDINNMETTLDKTKVTGSVKAIFAEKNKFDAQISVDDLNVDSYIVNKTEKSKNLAEAISNNVKKWDFLAYFDLDIKAVISSLIYNDVPIRGLYFEGSLAENKMSIKSLDIQNLAGLKALFQGNISGFGQEESEFTDFYYSLEGESLAPLMSRLEWDLPYVNEEELGFVSSSGTFNGSLHNLDFQTSVEAKGATINATGHFDKQPEQEEFFDMKLDASHLNFNSFVEIFSKEYSPEGGSLGVFKLSTQFKGNEKLFDLSDMDLGIGLNKIKGNVKVDLTGERPKFSGNTESPYLQLDKFFPKESFTVFSKTGNIKKRNFAQDNYVLSSAVFVPEKEPSLLIKTQTSPQFSTGIKSKPAISVIKFKTDLLSKFDLDINNNTENLEAFGYELEKAGSKIALTDKILNITDFNADYRNGHIQGNLTLDATEKLKLKGDISVTDMDGKEGFFGTNIIDVNGGLVSFQSTFETEGESQQEFLENLRSNGNITFKEASIRGFDLKSLNEETKGKRDLEKLQEMIMKYTDGGETAFATISGNFNILDGVIEANNIEMLGEQGSSKLDMSLNIKEWQVAYKNSIQTISNSGVPAFDVVLTGDAERPDFQLSYEDFEKYFKDLQDYDIRQEEARIAEEKRLEQEKLAEEERIKQEAFSKDQQTKKDEINKQEEQVVNAFNAIDKIAKEAKEAVSGFEEIFTKSAKRMEEQKLLVSEKVLLKATELFTSEENQNTLENVDTQKTTTLNEEIQDIFNTISEQQKEFLSILEQPELTDDDVKKSQELAKNAQVLMKNAESKNKEFITERDLLIKSINQAEQAFVRYIKLATIYSFIEKINVIEQAFPSIIEASEQSIDEANLEFAKLEGEYSLPREVDATLLQIRRSRDRVAEIKTEINNLYSKGEEISDHVLLDDLITKAETKEREALLEKENSQKGQQKILVLVNQTIETVRAEEERKKQLLDMLPGRSVVKPKESNRNTQIQENRSKTVDPRTLLQPSETRLERYNERQPIILKQEDLTAKEANVNEETSLNNNTVNEQTTTIDEIESVSTSVESTTITEKNTPQRIEETPDVGGSLTVHRRH